MPDHITITRATVEDAEAVLALIKRAFAAVAEQYDDPGMPPLTETLDEHRLHYTGNVVLKAVDDRGRIVGSIRGESRPDGSCYVARLVVDPAFQRRGIARALATTLEAELPDAKRFVLFTGHESVGSLALYRSLGYRETHSERQSDRLTFVWMEKTVE